MSNTGKARDYIARARKYIGTGQPGQAVPLVMGAVQQLCDLLDGEDVVDSEPAAQDIKSAMGEHLAQPSETECGCDESKRLLERCDSYREAYDRLSADAHSARAELAEVRKVLAERAGIDYRAELLASERQADELRTERDKLKAELTTAERDLKDAHDLFDSMADKRDALEVELDKLKVDALAVDMERRAVVEGVTSVATLLGLTRGS